MNDHDFEDEPITKSQSIINSLNYKWETIKEWFNKLIPSNKGSFVFTPHQKKFAIKVLGIMEQECPRYCSFLNQIDLEKINFFWNVWMRDSGSGVMGSWSFWHKNDLQIIAYSELFDDNSFVSNRYKTINVNEMRKLNALLENFPTFIHELNHYWEFQSAPIPYICNQIISKLFIEFIPGLKKFSLENWTDENTDRNKEVAALCNDLNIAFETRCRLQEFKEKADEKAEKGVEPDENGEIYNPYTMYNNTKELFERDCPDRIQKLSKELFDYAMSE